MKKLQASEEGYSNYSTSIDEPVCVDWSQN